MAWGKLCDAMKRIVPLLLSVWLLYGAAGCASSYKNVLVSVVDLNTGKPVASAEVTTSYQGQGSLVSSRSRRAFTDDSGLAVLKANYPAANRTLFGASRRPAFVTYKAVVGAGAERAEASDQTLLTWYALHNRPADYIPENPDVVIAIPTRTPEGLAADQARQRSKLAEAEAEKWIGRLEFWPEPGPDPKRWARGSLASYLLVSKRWELATKDPLGSPEDTESIRRTVTEHINDPKVSIGEIRWLSPSMVMVSSGCYDAPANAVAYLDVVAKTNSVWSLRAEYKQAAP